MKKIGISELFEKKPYSLLLAASTAVVWAFAFPLIKLGITEFAIAPNDTGAKTLFAGIRFFAAGLIVLLAAPNRAVVRPQPTNRSVARRSSNRDEPSHGALTLCLVLLLGLVNTALHYFCYYIGLSNQSGSRSAVIDSLSSFILILSACAVFRDEKMTRRKAAGCVLGFGGILLVNAGGGASAGFSLMGDGMLMLSAVFSAAGGLLTRIVTKRTSANMATGISLAFGGLLLMAAGALMGGRLSMPTPRGLFILCCLVGISTYGFSVYNKLLSCNPVGEIAIFNALIPILGVTFSCLLLREPFMLRYAAAGALVAAGIYIINSSSSEDKHSANKEDLDRTKSE